MKFLTGAVAAAALFACAGGAHATTYTISSGVGDGSLVPSDTYTVTTNQNKSGAPFTDYFNFALDNAYDGSFSAAFISNKNSQIAKTVLSLYYGTVSGAHSLLGSIDFFPSDNTQGIGTLNVDSLASGAYYLQADVTPQKGKYANYSVNVTLNDISAAPEPGVWALMIAGVGLAGASFRRSRKYRVNATFA